ncbi:unnamed protein product, partial [marine sediment metagenome]
MQNIVYDITRRVYYSSPRFIQRAAPYFVPSLRQFKKYLHELEESQWFSPKQLEELQNERLRPIIQHAYENVPHYRRIFDDRGLKPRDIDRIADLEKL